MNEPQWLADRFEQNRDRLRAIAFRMLGSLSEADDAVQESWLRLSRSGAGEIENIPAWLTTVVAHVCLDMLRIRKARREEALEEQPSEPAARRTSRPDPEHEALLADSVGLALLVVLDRLAPAERLAFVLHDMFDLSFDEIAPIVGRSPVAARQLASRARRRVHIGGSAPSTDISSQRKIVESFIAALRAGDVHGLVALLDPDFVVRTDQAAALPAAAEGGRGAEFWARQAIRYSQGAKAARVILVNGAVGVLVAPRGRLSRVLRFTITNGKIAELDVVGDAIALAALDLAILND
jgi:RNA polymerase sigma factor (sigma-70 family)